MIRELDRFNDHRHVKSRPRRFIDHFSIRNLITNSTIDIPVKSLNRDVSGPIAALLKIRFDEERFFFGSAPLVQIRISKPFLIIRQRGQKGICVCDRFDEFLRLD